MKYYKIKHEWRPEIMGNAELQVVQYWPHKGYSFYQDDPKCYVHLYKGKAAADTKFNRYALARNAKWTDLLTPVLDHLKFMLVSSKLIDILKNANADVWQQFDFKIPSLDEYGINNEKWWSILPNNVGKDYHLLYFPYSREECANLSKDNKFIRHPTPDTFKIDTIRSLYDDEKPIYNYFPQKVVMELEEDWDIFRLVRLGRGIYVSERLKTQLEEEGITGIVYEEADWMVFD